MDTIIGCAFGAFLLALPILLLIGAYFAQPDMWER